MISNKSTKSIRKNTMSKKPMLIKAYEMITREKRPYCFLCFSTDKETKLKAPKSVLTSVTKLVTHKSLHDEPPHICYMCERLALSAIRFQKATFFATSVDVLFKGMLDSWNYCEEVVKFLSVTTPPKEKDRGRYEAIVSYEKQITALRNMSRLGRSNVVVVETNEFTNEEANSNSLKRHREKEMPRRPSTPSDPLEDDIIILDDIDTSPTKKNKTDEPSILQQHLTQTPFIKIPLSGPECPSNGPVMGPKLVPIENLISDAPPNSMCYLHPIVVRNGEMSVPTLSAKIVDGQVIYTQKVKNVTPDSLRRPYLTVQSQEKEKMCYILTDRDGNLDIVPSVENSVEFSITSGGDTPDNVANLGNIEFTHPDNFAELTRLGKTVNIGSDMSELYNRPETINLESDGLNHINITEVTSGDVESKHTEEVILGDTIPVVQRNSVKEPLLKNDRIDWEDKIPMDVISFMDATDPNPPPFIKPLAPPSVGICNVRSLCNDPPNTGQTDEIIDLC